MDEKPKSSLFVILAMLIFSSMGIFARLTGQNGMVIAAVASFISAFFMFFILLKRHELRGILTKKIWLLFLIGAFGAANNSLYFYAFQLTKISSAVFLHYLAPIAVIMLSPFLLNEKITSRKAIAAIIAVVGLFLITGFGLRGGMALGNLLAMGSALAYAFSIITYKKAMKHFSVMQIIFMQMLLTFLIFSPFLFAKASAIPAISWAYLAIIGFVHQFIAVILHLKGLEKLNAVTVAILGYAEPAFALALAWIFLSESASLQAITGGVIILLSSYLAIERDQ